MRYIRIATVMTLFLAVIIAAADIHTAGAATTEEIKRDVNTALRKLYKTTPAAREIAEKSSGVLVFPDVIRGTLGVGGQYGVGALRVQGKTVAYYNSFQASFGFQAGVQSHGYAVFFMTNDALDYFRKTRGWELGIAPAITILEKGWERNFSTTTLKNDIYAFFFDRRGLMGGLSLQGTKYTEITPEDKDVEIKRRGIKLPVTVREMARVSQDPLSNLISINFENNFIMGLGPEDAMEYRVNLETVYPVYHKEWNIIQRFTLPVVHQNELFAGQGSKSGIGDFEYRALFTRPDQRNVIWGVGPSLVFPTTSDDRLGRDDWSIGPSAVVLSKQGPWVFGGQVEQIWSYGGEGDDTDLFSLKYFVNYNLADGWYATAANTITADWELDEDKWTVPLGGGVGRIVKFDGRSIDFRLQMFGYAASPPIDPDWAIQFQAKFLFPEL